ncbi:MAG: phosphoenolpyruvate hydrolase family protein [Pseudomonadota bacterium]
MVRRSRTLVGAAVGSGIVARAAEQGGADFLLAINAGRMRNMGAASIACMLPIHDASALTLQFATTEILPMTRLPVFVGVNPWNMTKSPDEIADEVLEAGFAGAANFPTAMHYSRGFRRVLDQSGLGTRAEISLLRAVEDAGGKSMFFCGSPRQARDGADAGLGAVIYNFGWNLGGLLGHQPRYSLEEAALKASEVSRYLKRQHSGLKLFLEGGPIARAEDLSFVSQLVDIDGYVGGSTIDRMPIETSIGDQIASYRLAMDGIRKSPIQDRKTHSLAAADGLVGQSKVFQGALAAIRRAARSQASIVLRVPKGGPTQQLLRLLDKLQPKGMRHTILDYTTLQGAPEHKLFGTTGHGGRTSLLRRPSTLVTVPDYDDLPQAVRGDIARAINTGVFHSVGSNAQTSMQARLLLVTEKAPDATILGDVALVEYPSVSQRADDFDLILGAALRHCGADDSIVRGLSARVRLRLKTHRWDENEAEVMRFAQALTRDVADGQVSLPAVEKLLEALPRPRSPDRTPASPREQLVEALARHNFRKGDTARALFISRKTLYNRMKKYGLL